MASRKSSAASKKDTDVISSAKLDTTNLELNKLVHKMATIEQDFVQNVKNLENFKSDTIFTLDAQINDRKRKLLDLQDEYEQEQKRRRIDMDNQILKDKFDAANKFLEAHNFIAVEKEKYANLEVARQVSEDEARKTIDKEKEHSKRAVSEAIKAQGLQHKAECADLQARAKQQEIQIVHLNSILERREKDIAAQIQLTKDVAESSRSGAISQNFGAPK